MQNLRKLSREELKKVDGGKIMQDEKPCGCVAAMCSGNGRDGDSYCSGTCC
ncbi:MAG: hypothetical protein LBE36_10560 [Flavobacteriaceae bacterium]|jgi:hypothetical protein|nr:hypothetical protein [Flavobacteriaceae bacterium]